MHNRGILDRLFPAKYDFFDFLSRQAQLNAHGVSALSDWLRHGQDSDSNTLKQLRQEADQVRQSLEKDLVEAFSTPIDRGDLYLLSVDMDRVMEYALSTLLSMEAFDVKTDGTIEEMTDQLKTGVNLFYEAVQYLKDSPAKAERLISGMRSAHVSIEQLYRDGMAVLFHGGDPMYALKLREVYHHIKDASSNLSYSVDILHKIIVGLT